MGKSRWRNSFCNHGGVAHRILVERIAKELIEKGFYIEVSGNRSGRYRGLPKVDIIAEKDNVIYLVECGWISDARIRDLREIQRLNGKQIKLLWFPYLHCIERQGGLLRNG